MQLSHHVVVALVGFRLGLTGNLFEASDPRLNLTEVLGARLIDGLEHSLELGHASVSLKSLLVDGGPDRYHESELKLVAHPLQPTVELPDSSLCLHCPDGIAHRSAALLRFGHQS
jgi:hypothetical protein